MGITFPFKTHASFYVLRWAIGLALNIKPSGSGSRAAGSSAFLGLTSLPSGLMYKESGGGRLKLDGQATKVRIESDSEE